jgi:peptidoglycan/xylan/chitin deacetylase (PgdA/CDA1 family)
MLRILAYHRIAELEETPVGPCPNISATPKAFLRQMRHLARHYRCVSMPEVLDAIERRRPLPKRAVLITFDDAYRDFADAAWPILRQCSLPATLFVPTAYPDHPELAFWWDRLFQAFAGTAQTVLRKSPLGALALTTPDQKRRALLALVQRVQKMPFEEAMELVNAVCDQLVEGPTRGADVLSWDRLRELAKDGVTLGSHTRTHPIMTRISSDRVRDEISGSREDLKKEIGLALPIFCYPNGDQNDSVTGILRSEGISLGFTVRSGENRLDSGDLLRLNRTCIWPRTSLPVFWMRLRRAGQLVDSWRQKLQRPVVTHPSARTEVSFD